MNRDFYVLSHYGLEAPRAQQAPVLTSCGLGDQGYPYVVNGQVTERVAPASLLRCFSSQAEADQFQGQQLPVDQAPPGFLVDIQGRQHNRPAFYSFQQDQPAMQGARNIPFVSGP